MVDHVVDLTSRIKTTAIASKYTSSKSLTCDGGIQRPSRSATNACVETMSCGISHDNCMRRNVTCHNRPCADHRVITNLHSGQYHNAGAERRAATDTGPEKPVAVTVARTGEQSPWRTRMGIIGKSNAWPYECPVGDGNTFGNGAVMLYRNCVANCYSTFNICMIANHTLASDPRTI